MKQKKSIDSETHSPTTIESSNDKNGEQIEKGKLSYDWALKSMKIITMIMEKESGKKPLSGLKVAFCLHITKETSVLVMAAKKLGAKVLLCSANPLSVQEDILEFLKSNDITIFAKKDQSEKEYFENISRTVECSPDLIVDDGSEMHVLVHKKKLKTVIGGTEETTSGIHRLVILDHKKSLLYPVIGVNNAYTKYLFDNRYGTGQSTVDGILRTTGIFIPGKNFVVCGYGWVGKGVSSCLRGLGAKVTVTEVDPIKALEAYMDGFNVSRMKDVAGMGDFFITCTGQTSVIRKEHIYQMKDGVFISNAGHFDVEIDIDYLHTIDKCPKQVRPYVQSFNVGGKKINLVSNGRVINLVGAEGHPPEVMALSFANQLLSIIYLAKNYKKMENILYPVPSTIDNKIAEYALDSFSVVIDKLTSEQIAYHKKANF